MQQIIIDEEFRSLLPALDRNTYALLEESLLEHGCRDALVTWNGILIDGYNRYRICTEHDIPFNTVSMEFASREEVLIWIISNQISRRNLTAMQLSHYRGLHYRTDKKIQGTYDRNVSQIEKGHNDPFQSSTAGRLSGQYRVSPKTIKRDAKVSETLDIIGEASPEAKRKILSGEISIDKKVLEALSSAPKEDIHEFAARIEDGTYEKKRPVTGDSEGNTWVGTTADSGAWITTPIGPPREDGNPGFDRMRPFETAIAKITDELLFEIRKTTSPNDTAELKTALRSYISMLEDLYRQL